MRILKFNQLFEIVGKTPLEAQPIIETIIKI